MDSDQQQLVTAEFKALYDGGICFEAVAYDGIADALAYLAAQTTLYVVTNKRKSIAEKILEHLSLRRFFDVIDGQAEDQFVLKQEILQRVMSQLGSDGAYIGDTKGDVDAAMAVGLTPYFALGDIATLHMSHLAKSLPSRRSARDLAQMRILVTGAGCLGLRRCTYSFDKRSRY